MIVYIFNHPAILQLLPLPTLFIITKRGSVWLWRRYQPLSYIDETTRELIIPKPIYGLWSVVCKGQSSSFISGYWLGHVRKLFVCLLWNLMALLLMIHYHSSVRPSRNDVTWFFVGCYCGCFILVNYHWLSGDQKILVLIESTISKVATVVLLCLLLIFATLFGLIVFAQVRKQRVDYMY